MESAKQHPWQETPATAHRLVSAVGRLAHVMRAAAWQFATAEGLTPTQADMLQLLAKRRTGVRLSWIARQLSITSATASDSVAALVAKGLVEKTDDTEDRRAVALSLTPAGTAVAQRAGAAVCIVEDAAAKLPEDVQTAVLLGLLQVIGELQKHERFPDLRACLTCRFFEAHRHPEAEAPHHCHLVGAPLPVSLLRIDCPEHEPATATEQHRNWEAIR